MKKQCKGKDQTRLVWHKYRAVTTKSMKFSWTHIQESLRASPTHNTILVSKLHYFSAVLALNVFDSPTTTPNLTLKRIFSIIKLLKRFFVFNFLVEYLIFYD